MRRCKLLQQVGSGPDMNAEAYIYPFHLQILAGVINRRDEDEEDARMLRRPILFLLQPLQTCQIF